jgi:hypothetical protein
VDEVEEAMGGKARVGLSQGITRTLDELTPVLDRHKGRSLVIGGIAVIARGVPRVTREIDIAFCSSCMARGWIWRGFGNMCVSSARQWN